MLNLGPDGLRRFLVALAEPDGFPAAVGILELNRSPAVFLIVSDGCHFLLPSLLNSNLIPKVGENFLNSLMGEAFCLGHELAER